MKWEQTFFETVHNSEFHCAVHPLKSSCMEQKVKSIFSFSFFSILLLLMKINIPELIFFYH